jgi:hypothetical protein
MARREASRADACDRVGLGSKSLVPRLGMADAPVRVTEVSCVRKRKSWVSSSRSSPSAGEVRGIVSSSASAMVEAFEGCERSLADRDLVRREVWIGVMVNTRVMQGDRTSHAGLGLDVGERFTWK